MSFLNHEDSYCAVCAERVFLKRIGGGCDFPIAAYGEIYPSSSYDKDIIPLSPPLLKGDLGGFSERRKSKWNFSLDDLNLFQMAELGIPLKNISGTNLCTSCNNDLFFSYRREKGITGRLLSFVMLNEIKTKDQDPTQTNL